MDYPHIPQHIDNEALFEHFNLTQDERYSLPRWRKDQNMLGYVVLLKAYAFLGFPPRKKGDVPQAVVSWISRQLDVDPAEYQGYRWKSRLWDIHLAAIRDHTGFRPGSKEDYKRLGQWLTEKATRHPTRSNMYAAAIHRCHSLKIELPTEKELQRLVGSSWRQYLSKTCKTITDRLESSIRKKMDLCLDVDPQGKRRYNWMKGKPGKMGLKTLNREIRRLRFVNGFEIQADTHLADVPKEVMKLLRERAVPEDAYQMKRHRPAYHRYALMAVLLHYRRMELTDNIIDIFLTLIRRIQKKADRKLEKELIGRIRTVYKKREILYLLAKASVQNPRDTVESALFPVVGEEVLYRIIEEYEGQDLSYDNTKTVEKKDKYTRSYRRMVKPVLDTLVFRATNPERQSLDRIIFREHRQPTCFEIYLGMDRGILARKTKYPNRCVHFSKVSIQCYRRPKIQPKSSF